MTNYVLDARIYFTDLGNAENAYYHIKALADHSAAHDIQVGGEVEGSWGRLHECKADDNEGDTSFCETIEVFGDEQATPDEPATPGDAPEWQPNEAVVVGDLRSYQDIIYSCLQAHTTQVGWEPPNTPALWELA